MPEVAGYLLAMIMPALMHGRYLSKGVYGQRRAYSGPLARFPLLLAFAAGLAVAASMSAFASDVTVLGYAFAALGAGCWLADIILYLAWSLAKGTK